MVLFSTSCIEFPAGDPDKLKDPKPSEPAPEPVEGLPPEIVATLPPGFPTSFLEGQKLGEECSASKSCRDGLVCRDDVCVASGDSEIGDNCVLSQECDGAQCVDNECVPAGNGVAGTSCIGLAQCAPGMRCGLVNLAPQCVPEGEGDVGQGCTSSADCAAGLACVQANAADTPTCSPVRGGPPAVPALWSGISCEEADKSHVRAYFEIPGAPDAEEADFFRLPFPNDVRTDDRGRVDVSDFPTPGVNPLVGVDPIAAYVKAVDGMQGWGTNSTVTFRFSGPIDLDSFKTEGGVTWIDITDPADPIRSGVAYQTTTANSNYVCGNMLSIRRPDGFPMRDGHVYAVILGSTGKSSRGVAIERAPNFDALLEDSAPANAVLAKAHAKYAPLRAYMAAQNISADDILVATVLTVGPSRKPMTDLAETIADLEPPTASDWTLCDEGVKSPCAQAEETRACGKANAKYAEYHALVELPIFQQGEPPYLNEGGKVQTDEPVRSEQVCMALTVPKGVAAPEGGWPLVVFTHGTGGSFRSHMNNTTVVGSLTAAKTPDGVVPFAVLGFDQVQHGPRRGESEQSPDNLYFNFLNPDAAQGNPMQGAADVLSIGRFAANLDLDAETTGGEAIKIDPERIVYFGHSQGSMAGSLALPFAPEYKAAVLSGNGVSLQDALLTKTQPVNIASIVPLVINDGSMLDFETGVFGGKLPGADHHPVLSLVQQYIDPADPLNFAEQIAREPLEGMKPKHIFQTYGLGDTYSPPQTMQIYITRAQLNVVKADSSASPPDDLGEESEVFPFAESFAVEDVPYTTAARQYGPKDGSDGHFVVFDVPTATADAARFLGMAASGMTPQVGE